ncbi:MAG TPA: hypothetical protein VNO51_17720, partial [Ilumatobacteraceae bacterium]|nr:hypothetical protein [Ilumatobacteraceae bacterium]
MAGLEGLETEVLLVAVVVVVPVQHAGWNVVVFDHESGHRHQGVGATLGGGARVVIGGAGQEPDRLVDVPGAFAV